MNINDHIKIETLSKIGKETYDKFREVLRKHYNHVISEEYGNFEKMIADGFTYIVLDESRDLSGCIGDYGGAEYTAEMIKAIIEKYEEQNEHFEQMTISELKNRIVELSEQVVEQEKILTETYNQITKFNLEKTKIRNFIHSIMGEDF